MKQKLNDQWNYEDSPIRPKYYAKYRIDPWTFIMANNLPMDVGSVIKYVVRHQDKNGEEDLDKAIQCLRMMKEHHYGDKRSEKECDKFDLAEAWKKHGETLDLERCCDKKTG